jgi:hypothetical protein
MKTLKNLMFVPAIIAFIFSSCGGKEVTDASDISLSQITAELNNTDAPVIELTATLSPVGATSEIVWTSSNNAVATVSSLNGKTAAVTAVGAGEVTITATANGHQASCRVNVTWEIPTVEATFSIQHGVVVGDDMVYEDVADGSEIIITDYEQGSPRDPRRFEFLGRIRGESTLKMSVTLTRSLAEGNDYDEFCSESCWVSNGQTTQTFTWDFLYPAQDFYAHSYMHAEGETRIVYDFFDNAQPDVHVKITVIYRNL